MGYERHRLLLQQWDEKFQTYELYWTPRPIHERWLSKSYAWVFIQELPWDKNKEDFVWTELGTHATKRELKYQRFVQKMQFLKKQQREKRAAEVTTPKTGRPG